MKNYLLLVLAIGLMCSCHDSAHSNNYDSEKSVDDNYSVRTEEHQKKPVRTVSVIAEVFHVIPHTYDGGSSIKDANRTTTISLTIYDDGSVFMSGGDFNGGWVRYSRLSGYEYECNSTGGDVYAFNYDF